MKNGKKPLAKNGWRKVGGEFDKSFRFSKPGDFIAGKFLAVKKDIELKKYKNKSNVYIIQNHNDNKKYSVWGSGLLDYLMLKAKDCPKIGDIIAITFLGKEKIKGKQTNQFEVKIAF